MSMPNIINADPSSLQVNGTPTSAVTFHSVSNPRSRQSVRASLSTNVATSTLDAGLEAEASSKPSDLDDPALIIGLSLWTAPRHQRYVAAVAARGDGSVPHRFPAVLASHLRRHAEAGDPTCRLVLDWLSAKGLFETGTGRSLNEGAV